jgi:hypothetical protein
MAALGAWVQERMLRASDERDEPLGREGIAILDSLLASPFTLKVPLGHWLAEDEQTLEALTPQQFHILEAVQDIGRAGIAGGAGTGKTVLAMEDARRYAAAGLKTLLVCHSKPLAEELRRRMARVAPSVDCGTFHDVAMRCASAASLYFEARDTSQFFRETLPELFLKGLDKRPELRWDVIIVDEGQDFEPVWWIALDAALIGNASSRLHIFFDCNQTVYDRGGKPPDDVNLIPIRLTRNLRNTRAIHDVAMRHYDGIEILPNDTQGQKVLAVLLPKPGDIEPQLHDLVRKLVKSDRVAPGSIAVLHDGQEVLKILLHRGLLGDQPVCSADVFDDEMIVFDTIQRFKGLERATIVVCATSGLLKKAEPAYVAASRARVHLIVIGSEPSVNWIIDPN